MNTLFQNFRITGRIKYCVSSAGMSLNVYFTTCFFNDAVIMKGEDIEPVSNRKVNNQNTW